jgi:hypothetical protein
MPVTKTAPAWTCAILEPNALTVIIRGRCRELLDLPVAKPRERSYRARYSLPASGAEAPRIHLAHVAHADQADTLALLHVECGGTPLAMVVSSLSP